jgi:transcriptional regulator with XRE-family HTH domain
MNGLRRKQPARKAFAGKFPDTAQLVRALRERLGLTQEKLAARLGVTFPTVNRWENSRARPSPLALKQIEELLAGLGDKGQDLHAKYFPNGGL